MSKEIVYNKQVKMLPEDMEKFIVLIGMNETEADLEQSRAVEYRILIEKVNRK